MYQASRPGRVESFRAGLLGASVRRMVNLGTVPGDPDDILASTTDPDRVTVWLGAARATDLTSRDVQELAALLQAVRELDG